MSTCTPTAWAEELHARLDLNRDGLVRPAEFVLCLDVAEAAKAEAGHSDRDRLLAARDAHAALRRHWGDGDDPARFSGVKMWDDNAEVRRCRLTSC